MSVSYRGMGFIGAVVGSQLFAISVAGATVAPYSGGSRTLPDVPGRLQAWTFD